MKNTHLFFFCCCFFEAQKDRNRVRALKRKSPNSLLCQSSTQTTCKHQRIQLNFSEPFKCADHPCSETKRRKERVLLGEVKRRNKERKKKKSINLYLKIYPSIMTYIHIYNTIYNKLDFYCIFYDIFLTYPSK